MTPSTKQKPCGKHHGDYLEGEPVISQRHQKSHLMLSRRPFLLKSGTLSTLRKGNHMISTSRTFLNYRCKLYFKLLSTPPQHKIIVAYYTSDHRLAIESGCWSTIPVPRDNILCHFFSYNFNENKAQFVLGCPLTTRLEIISLHYLTM